MKYDIYKLIIYNVRLLCIKIQNPNMFFLNDLMVN